MFKTYAKKPVEVQAVKLSAENANEVAKACGGMVVEEFDAIDHTKTHVGVNIPTLEGTMRASEGDYVVRGVRGEFYPCKPGIFEETYDGDFDN